MVTKCVDIADIIINEDRIEGGNGNIDGLAANIKKYGQINPIKVQEVKAVGVSGFRLIAGRRRVAAAGQLGWTSIRADVYEQDDEIDTEGIGLSENTSREDMHPLDEGVYFAKMLASGEKAEDIAALFCRTKSQVYQRAKLNRLVPAMKDIFKQGKMTITVAAMIAETAPDVQEKVFDKISKDSYVMRNGVSRFDVSAQLAKIYKTEIGRDFTCKKCEKCTKRTRFADSTLFPELEGEKDRCLDYDCYQKNWDKFVAASYKKCMDWAATGECKIKLDEKPGILLINGSSIPSWNMPGSSGKKFVKLDDRNIPLLSYEDISNLTEQQAEEEELIDYRSRGILHGGITWDGSFFKPFYFVYNKEAFEKKEDETESQEKGKEELNTVYASLPEEDRNNKVTEELQKGYWQRTATQIERSYYSKLNEIVNASIDNDDYLPVALFAAAAVEEYSSDMQELYPDYPAECNDGNEADAYEFIMHKIQDREDELILEKFVIKKLLQCFTRNAFCVGKRQYGPALLVELGEFNNVTDAEKFCSDLLAETVDEHEHPEKHPELSKKTEEENIEKKEVVSESDSEDVDKGDSEPGDGEEEGSEEISSLKVPKKERIIDFAKIEKAALTGEDELKK